MPEKYNLERPDGTVDQLEAINHPNWESLKDPCPDCGGTEFEHYTAEGKRLGHCEGIVVLRNDFEAATESILTRCLDCRTTLYKHPMADTLENIPVVGN